MKNNQLDFDVNHKKQNKIVFTKDIHNCGSFQLRPIDLLIDIPIISEWVSKEYAKYWGMSKMTVDQIREEYKDILSDSNVFVGLFNNQLTFLLECYHPKDDVVGLYYDIQNGDYGMHILVAPTENPIPNFTWNVFTVVMDFIFSDDKIDRIIVEPDVRNEKIHLLNKRAGFEYQKQIVLPEKIAHLAFCTREQYAEALKMNKNILKSNVINYEHINKFIP